MINAKQELLGFIGRVNVPVKCATIQRTIPSDSLTDPDVFKEYNLPVNHDKDDYIYGFLESLDFEYNNGYGEQELYGTIWFEDGTWADRWEYDGAEGWKLVMLPQIPLYLKLKKAVAV